MARNDLETHYRYLLDNADELLQWALTGDPDQTLPGFIAEIDSTHYRPGRDVSIGFQVSYGTAGGQAEEYLVATTARVRGKVAVLKCPGYTFRVWRHPHDPVLRAAPEAFSPEAVAGWLARAGYRNDGLDLSALAYRPMRRAVLKASTGERDFFVKLQRPARHLEYLERAAVLAPAGITPPVLTVPAEGVSVTPATGGVSLAHALADWSMNDAVEPDPASLVDLLRRIPLGVLNVTSHADWGAELASHVEAARVALPDRASEIGELAAAIAAKYRVGELGPEVGVHGDFYEANVFTIDGRATSFIDIEGVGRGHLVDDLACMMAHVALLPALSSTHYERLPDLIPRWQCYFESLVHPATFRARVAGVLLSLVSGAEPEQARARLDLALGYCSPER